jgi:hypothetical protein
MGDHHPSDGGRSQPQGCHGKFLRRWSLRLRRCQMQSASQERKTGACFRDAHRDTRLPSGTTLPVSGIDGYRPSISVTRHKKHALA